jgi:hypothetical protein
MATPGWYQDPADPTVERWWDGTQWTEHTQQVAGQPWPGGRDEQSAEPAGSGGTDGYSTDGYSQGDPAASGFNSGGSVPAASPAQPATPAGWYADPADATLERWWDGERWTDHTQQAPSAHWTPSTPPSSSPAGFAAPAAPGAYQGQAWPQMSDSAGPGYYPGSTGAGSSNLGGSTSRSKVPLIAAAVGVIVVVVGAVFLFSRGAGLSAFEKYVAETVEQKYLEDLGYEVTVVSVSCDADDFADGDVIDTECSATLKDVKRPLPLLLTGTVSNGRFNFNVESKYNLASADELVALAESVAPSVLPTTTGVTGCDTGGPFLVLYPGDRFKCTVTLSDGPNETIVLEASPQGDSVALVSTSGSNTSGPTSGGSNDTEPVVASLAAFCAAHATLEQLSDQLDAADNSDVATVEQLFSQIQIGYQSMVASAPDEILDDAVVTAAAIDQLIALLSVAGWDVNSISPEDQALASQVVASVEEPSDRIDSYADSNC